MPTIAQKVADTIAANSTPEQWPLEQVAELYAPDVHFVDPLQDFTGRDTLLQMMKNLRERFAYIRFVDLSVVGDDSHFFISYTMRIRLKFGPEFSTFGASEFRTRDGLVVFHRDAWDPIGTFMNGIPGIGTLYRRALHLMFG